jgi:hypothetical protein
MVVLASAQGPSGLATCKVEQKWHRAILDAAIPSWNQAEQILTKPLILWGI